jgi:hypothetical protein
VTLVRWFLTQQQAEAYAGNLIKECGSGRQLS